MQEKTHWSKHAAALVGYTGAVILAVVAALIPVYKAIYDAGRNAAYEEAVISTALKSPDLLNTVCYQWWFSNDTRLKKAPKR